MTPQNFRSFTSPVPTTPLGSGSSGASWFGKTPTHRAGHSEPADADRTITQVSYFEDPLAGILPSQTLDSQAPLLALFPSDLTVPASRTTSVCSSEVLDLSSTPQGPCTWPWRYVCDMAAGFDAMHILQDANPEMSWPEVFTQVFQHTFKVSTYNEQYRAWWAAGQTPGEREHWVAAGRSEQGEWSNFMCIW